MAKQSYLKMMTESDANELIHSDLKDLATAAKKLANHAIHLGSLGFGTSFLKWVASFAAIYLLVLDRTNWKSNILTGLLIPYIFFTLPSILFNFFRGQIGRWIALVAVILRIFFPKHFPEWLELPAALILLIVVAPSLIANTVRGDWIGVVICLIIAGYLLQEHIRAAGGFRNAFTKANGVSNTVGIVILFVYPVWALVLDIL
ncbi:cold-regulated 413 plasma membrane protein 1 [Prunus yedoensis var. nudiflora]|uniref:Cold-regulated 413 plasma membrane protein 1 n=1 Tax=Prunus yedoensis var. nudiflora TaxID=2094558 RepID=A0A314YG94_PRUYE|nr:cold-regulated 413 plasma membrane protein 1 [Prunus yedoensis var. nudiflora]